MDYFRWHYFHDVSPLLMIQPLILASQSPRRKQLLELAEIPFEVFVHETDESFPASMSMIDASVHVARQKALAIQSLYPERSILAADTMVGIHNEIIGKPKNRDEAIQILEKLSGHKHLVVTGVVILNQQQEIAFADITEVEFHRLNRQQIEYYIDQYKPYDKAGAYAIQEWIGAIAIKKINGCFYNVMGLPVSRVVQALNDTNKNHS
jgi:septum formation protein